jgi:hypothetical protein
MEEEDFTMDVGIAGMLVARSLLFTLFFDYPHHFVNKANCDYCNELNVLTVS